MASQVDDLNDDRDVHFFCIAMITTQLYDSANLFSNSIVNESLIIAGVFLKISARIESPMYRFNHINCLLIIAKETRKRGEAEAGDFNITKAIHTMCDSRL